MKATALLRRGGQLIRITRTEGHREVLRRLVVRLGQRVGADQPVLPLAADDVIDSATLSLPDRPPARLRGTALHIAWVCSPPSEGSGGHTTMFRFIRALEEKGHQCTLYVYDRFGNDAAVHNRVVRSWWPDIKAEIRDANDGIAGADAYLATSWASAHILAGRAHGAGHRFYLAQDFEPFFYPRGSLYSLAEDTYRFGFEHLTVGHMVANVLRDEIGVPATVAEFGCDRAVYQVTNPAQRRDVIFYAKPDTPRRGFQLGVLALQRFHQTHPDVGIHIFGSEVNQLPFPVISHRHVRTTELAALYNQCAAGLAFSFTNISLIAQELLACGVIPIVNDDAYTRADLQNPHVGWSSATPDGVAAALARAVRGERAKPDVVAASVPDQSWNAAQQTIVSAIEARCYGFQAAPQHT